MNESRERTVKNFLGIRALLLYGEGRVYKPSQEKFTSAKIWLKNKIKRQAERLNPRTAKACREQGLNCSKGGVFRL